MGAEVYPVFNPRVPSAKFDADGKLLLREFETLDTIAVDLGLTPFSAFGDNREIPDDFDGDPYELDELLGEWDEWFSIADGLRTIHGIASTIDTNQEAAAQFDQPEYIVADLRSLANALRIANGHGAQFRLEVA